MRFAATRLLAGGAICTTSAAKRAAASADSASSDSSGKPAPPQSDCELDAAHLSNRRVFLLGDVLHFVKLFGVVRLIGWD